MELNHNQIQDLRLSDLKTIVGKTVKIPAKMII